MIQNIRAIFDAGVFRPLEPVDLAEGTQVEVQVRSAGAERSPDVIVRQTEATPRPDFVEQTHGSCDDRELESKAVTKPGATVPADAWRAKFEQHLTHTPATDATTIDDSRESIYEGRGE